MTFILAYVREGLHHLRENFLLIVVTYDSRNIILWSPQIHQRISCVGFKFFCNIYLSHFGIWADYRLSSSGLEFGHWFHNHSWSPQFHIDAMCWQYSRLQLKDDSPNYCWVNFVYDGELDQQTSVINNELNQQNARLDQQTGVFCAIVQFQVLRLWCRVVGGYVVHGPSCLA